MANLNSNMKVNLEFHMKYHWWLILYAVLWISLAAFVTGLYIGRFGLDVEREKQECSNAV